jgi:hypothetical protein
MLCVYCSNFPHGFSTSMVGETWSITALLSRDSLNADAC